MRRTMLSNAKFEVEKFDGTNNFDMWPKDYSDEDWNFINRQTCGTIRLCLGKDLNYFVMFESVTAVLWKKIRGQVHDKEYVSSSRKDELNFIDISNALVNNEYRKKDQHDHRDSILDALDVTRGRSNNKKLGGSNNRGQSRSKSRGESSRRNLAKDECAYYHQKGYWKKDCLDKDKPNENVA
uniref:Uncharacterized protein n=1 Tax=Cannabis sativa TaxID=3483 RepID=A0A803PHE0_CANSA